MELLPTQQEMRKYFKHDMSRRVFQNWLANAITQRFVMYAWQLAQPPGVDPKDPNANAALYNAAFMDGRDTFFNILRNLGAFLGPAQSGQPVEPDYGAEELAKHMQTGDE